MDQKILLGSLAMDLKRIALGLHRNSLASASVFRQEALKKSCELETQLLDDYTKSLLDKTKQLLKDFKKESSEDFLMFSTLYQNQALKK